MPNPLSLRLKTRQPTRRGGPVPLADREVPHAIEAHLGRLNDVALRSALNTSRTVRAFGARYAVANTAFWKNEHAYPVSVVVEVVKVGPVGSTATVDGFPLPADTVGGRSEAVALDPNESLSILFSDAAIEARLIIRTPRSPKL